MFIKEFYDADVKRINEERPPLYREQNVGWPSESLVTLGSFAVGECRRSLFYKSLGVPYTDKMPVYVRRICDVGNRVEDVLINQFKEAKMYLADQVRIEFKMPNTKNEVIFSGKIDVVIQDEGIIKGIEIKSVSGYKANKIFGTAKGAQPLPAPNNLMQAMGYKYHSMRGNIGDHKVEEVYLYYIDRGSDDTFAFKIDLDEEGWPIITPISTRGEVYPTIRFQGVDSYDVLEKHSTVATSKQSALAELRININDVFKKFDTSYDYIREKSLPPGDYQWQYSDEELEKQFHCGRISKIKYNKHKKSEKCGDARCGFCNYRTKCREDNGIRLK